MIYGDKSIWDAINGPSDFRIPFRTTEYIVALRDRAIIDPEYNFLASLKISRVIQDIERTDLNILFSVHLIDLDNYCMLDAEGKYLDGIQKKNLEYVKSLVFQDMISKLKDAANNLKAYEIKNTIIKLAPDSFTSVGDESLNHDNNSKHYSLGVKKRRLHFSQGTNVDIVNFFSELIQYKQIEAPIDDICIHFSSSDSSLEEIDPSSILPWIGKIGDLYTLVKKMKNDSFFIETPTLLELCRHFKNEVSSQSISQVKDKPFFNQNLNRVYKKYLRIFNSDVKSPFS